MTVADVILGYDDYVRRKLALVIREGLSAKPKECGLFDHQRVLVEAVKADGAGFIDALRAFAGLTYVDPKEADL